MRKNIIKKISTTQKIFKFSKICLINTYYKSIFLSKYSKLPSTKEPLRTTKYVPVCQIQGNCKRTLKVFQFNRHIIRSNTYKYNFSSLTSNTW
jgi:hypothetical protein